MITATRHKKTGDFRSQTPIMGSMRNRGSFVTLVIPLVVLLGANILCAHEFELGHVERSIDVIVRGSKLEMKYSIGLSDETIVNWLANEGSIEAADEQRFRALIADYEAQSENTADEGAIQNGSTQQPKAKSAASSQAEEFPAEPLAFQTELIELLKDRLASKICENLKITSDEKALEFEDPVVSTSPRHHVAMEILLRAELPKLKSIQLSIIDKNFLESNDLVAPNSEGLKPITKTSPEENENRDTKESGFRYCGNIRLACRVKGDAVQLRSNVAPVLARAKAVNVELLDFDQRVEAASIVTKIGFVNPTKP